MVFPVNLKKVDSKYISKKIYPMNWYDRPYEHTYAYEDCSKHYKDDCYIVFREHIMDDCLYYGLSLEKNTFEIEYEISYYNLKVIGDLTINEPKKVIQIEHLSYISTNRWDVVCRIPSSEGSMPGLRKLEKKYFPNHSILGGMIRHMFGREWKVDQRPCKGHFDGKYGNYDWYSDDSHPWSQTVLYVNMLRSVSATKIQAAFRGWKDRMEYRFNPNKTLGKHIALKLLDEA